MTPKSKMNIAVTGSSGLVGSALLEALFASGYSITSLKRDTGIDAKTFWDFPPTKSDGTEQIAYIHLAGENVANGRWSGAKKKKILQSRILGTRALVDHILQQNRRPESFLCASAIGYYGDRGKELLTEKSSSGEGFLADVCRQWEDETRPLQEAGIRVVNLRFGMILSPKGGALHKMIPPFQMGLGGTIGSGRQFMSWISIDDVLAAIIFILNQKTLEGPINIVSPEPVTNKEFSRALGRALNRPTLLPLPAFAVKAGFGQMANEMLLGSSRVRPQRLIEAGFNYQHEVLDAALQYCTT